MIRYSLLLLALIPSVAHATANRGADKEFSGPQVGEKLPSFKVRRVFEDAGKEFDFVKQSAGKPLVLVFVHDANRPSIGMTRVLLNYTTSLAKDKDKTGLTSGLVWLAGDVNEAENTLKRIRHALPQVTTGISLDGQEGPGSYGLNRKMTLTILVAKDNKVTGNFALVQPSLKADLPRILEAIAAVTNTKAPKLEDLPEVKNMLQPAPAPDENLRALLRPLIQKNADPKEVDKAATVIEDYIRKNPKAATEVGRIARTIVESGKLGNYGTERAQQYLREWAKKYSKNAPIKREEKP